MEARIETLFQDYAAMVYRVCLRYLGDRDEAEDMVQEVFLKVDRSLSGFQGGSAVSTWIYRIAANTCLDHLRASKRRAEFAATLLDEMPLKNLPSGGDRVLARIDLDRLLEEVKPEVREFLFLTQLEGMSYEEAAAVTGKKVDAIAKAVSRFKKAASSDPRFQEMLAGQEKTRRAV
jgi:RNA polymerase sigma-70 factor (ECF subfamily)